MIGSRRGLCPEGIQGARRMPWRREPTKGAASRDSPGGAAHRPRSRGARMGEPSRRGPATRFTREATGGTETSKYPEERKSRRDPPSSGERTGASPNRGARKACGRCRPGVEDAASGPRTARPQSQSTCPAEDAWEGARHRVRAPYAKARACGPQSGVPPGTRNPAGSRGDRPPRLSTTLRPTVHEYREGKVKSTPGGE